MKLTDILFPDYAEDGDEKAKLIKWMVSVGQAVREDEEIVELLTDKAAFTVTAPASGVLHTIDIQEGEEVTVGQRLGVIESAESEVNP